MIRAGSRKEEGMMWLKSGKIIYNKKGHIAALMIFLAVISGCGKKKEQAIEENLRPVKVEKIGNNKITLGYTASGSLKGKEEIPYIATSGGEITVLNAKDGDVVNAGQVIIAIDNQAARSGVQNAQSVVSTAQSNISMARAGFEEARINYEKYRMLYDKRLITETEYLSAKTAYSSARANLSAMENSLSSARANLQMANDTNSKSVIRSNINGVINGIKVERHQQVSPGQPLFTVINEEEMVMEVGVSSQVIGKIKVGTRARIRIDELANREVEGEIYEVSAAAQGSTRQFNVKIRMTNDDRTIKSGMYGTASIDTGAEEGVVIPKTAIVVRGVEQIAYIIREGKAVAVPVRIVNQNEKYAVVTGEGMAEGAELIIEGQNVVQDGEKVKKVN